MKAQSFGKPSTTFNSTRKVVLGKQYSRGVSTLEILIAFAVLTLTITAVISVVFGNQSIVVDTQTNVEAISKAQAMLEQTRALSRQNFSAVVTATSTWTPSPGSLMYYATTSVDDLTQCKKQATSDVAWTQGGRNLSISLTTFLTDIAGALALGGDCEVNPSSKKWDAPQRFASDTLVGKSTAIDVLKQIAYVGQDKKPFLSIADTRGAVLNQTSGLFINFDNGFNADGKVIDQINDIDVASTTGRAYAFVAMASTTAQLAVIDVTDIHNPKLVAKRQLSGVTAVSSDAWGWRVYYHDKKVYIGTQYLACPSCPPAQNNEFHIFDVSDPTNPNWEASINVNRDINDIVVRDGLSYLAIGQGSSAPYTPLKVFDINPLSPTYLQQISSFSSNDDKKGLSVYLTGTRLFFGRESTASGPELYILDASNPRGVSGGLPIIGLPREIGGDVLAIRVVGQYGFLISSKSNEEFQVWNISNPSIITLIKKYNFGNVVAGGMDYEPDFIYATGNATPNFQILYSPS